MSTDLHTLSGAYAIDALSAEEAAEFRIHLEGCAACREEVRELRAAAGEMGASEAAPPPAHMRSRILNAANQTPQLPPKVAQRSHARPTRWAPRLLGAAAALVLVIGGILGVTQLIDDEESLPTAVSQVFESSDARPVTVETERGTIRVATSPGRNEMAIDTRELEELPDGRVYQLWSVVEGTATSAGILEDTDAGAAMAMPQPGARVAITVEPAGGSVQPTSEPIVQLDPAAI